MDFSQAFDGFIENLVKLFPASPFRQFLEVSLDSRGLQWLNWFVPIPQIIAVLQAWLVAVGVFYLYSVVARWVKLIGD